MHLALLLTIDYMLHSHSQRYNNSINTTLVNVYDNIHIHVQNDKLVVHGPVYKPTEKERNTGHFPSSISFSSSLQL